MSATGLEVFDTTVQQTNLWLKAIQDRLNSDDRHFAYLALRGTLHVLRDRLPAELAVHLGAQLPMLIRGFYYEEWHPAGTPSRERHVEEFLEKVAKVFAREPPADLEAVVQGVLEVLAARIDPGQVSKVIHALPPSCAHSSRNGRGVRRSRPHPATRIRGRSRVSDSSRRSSRRPAPGCRVYPVGRLGTPRSNRPGTVARSRSKARSTVSRPRSAYFGPWPRCPRCAPSSTGCTYDRPSSWATGRSAITWPERRLPSPRSQRSHSSHADGSKRNRSALHRSMSAAGWRSRFATVSRPSAAPLPGSTTSDRRGCSPGGSRAFVTLSTVSPSIHRKRTRTEPLPMPVGLRSRKTLSSTRAGSTSRCETGG